ncbi:hypothetical protein U4960_10850 [Altererythrobacter sp. H2]|uniref:hypothetical protein n=1 Tax=Altererythrobacter sp. H2 TaxID=3108391 RepID=UPI002B4BBBF7|nr:hypothetical protein [Altererythrobacter sp. H2]WRK94796.1 hypothetical protein U4960_10850 [Altererythrobacter sp. H2]
MRNLKITLAAATGLALSLAACGNEPDNADTLESDTAVTDTTVADSTVSSDEFNPLERDYTLSAEAQERRAEFDVDEFNSQFRELHNELAQSGSATGTTTTGGTTTTTSPGSTTTTTGQMGTGSGLMERSAMNWSYLDRNSDGRLSVAEYAIWAIPMDPNAPRPNDDTTPYVTADQANRAADSFFYYDQDGDGYLSQVEFNNARRGGDVN